ncbi:DUF2470 domain-containing protein [Micromonospora sp. NPDC002296]|uniref:DUF2470 domain-containing protein n=1 Tax=Micromonospora sp. NPDC002296 TaxID=3154271 RepID=UPI00333212BF
MSGKISPTGVAVAVGTPAERLRTLLVAADSVTLLTSTHRADLTHRHSVGGDGRVRIELPTGSGASRQLACEEDVPVVVEMVDLAPIPMPDRVRGRATLTGWLTVEGLRGRRPDVVAALHLATAELVDGDGTTPVDPQAFASARPDPLASAEAELVRRLGTDASTLDQLTLLVPASLRQRGGRVRLLRIDRTGVVMRVQAPALTEGATATAGPRDVRLAFTRPLYDPDQLGARLDVLLGRPPRRMSPTRR